MKKFYKNKKVLITMASLLLCFTLNSKTMAMQSNKNTNLDTENKIINSTTEEKQNNTTNINSENDKKNEATDLPNKIIDFYKSDNVVNKINSILDKTKQANTTAINTEKDKQKNTNEQDTDSDGDFDRLLSNIQPQGFNSKSKEQNNDSNGVLNNIKPQESDNKFKEQNNDSDDDFDKLLSNIQPQGFNSKFKEQNNDSDGVLNNITPQESDNKFKEQNNDSDDDFDRLLNNIQPQEGDNKSKEQNINTSNANNNKDELLINNLKKQFYEFVKKAKQSDTNNTNNIDEEQNDYTRLKTKANLIKQLISFKQKDDNTEYDFEKLSNNIQLNNIQLSNNQRTPKLIGKKRNKENDNLIEQFNKNPTTTKQNNTTTVNTEKDKQKQDTDSDDEFDRLLSNIQPQESDNKFKEQNNDSDDEFDRLLSNIQPQEGDNKSKEQNKQIIRTIENGKEIIRTIDNEDEFLINDLIKKINNYAQSNTNNNTNNNYEEQKNITDLKNCLIKNKEFLKKNILIFYISHPENSHISKHSTPLFELSLNQLKHLKYLKDFLISITENKIFENPQDEQFEIILKFYYSMMARILLNLCFKVAKITNNTPCWVAIPIIHAIYNRCFKYIFSFKEQLRSTRGPEKYIDSLGRNQLEKFKKYAKKLKFFKNPNDEVFIKFYAEFKQIAMNAMFKNLLKEDLEKMPDLKGYVPILSAQSQCALSLFKRFIRPLIKFTDKRPNNQSNIKK